MNNKIISSIKIMPVQPRYPVRDVGILQVDAINKRLVVYDDEGNFKEIGKDGISGNFIQNININGKLGTVENKVAVLDLPYIQNIKINGISGIIDENKIANITVANRNKLPSECLEGATKIIDICNNIKNKLLTPGHDKTGLSYYIELATGYPAYISDLPFNGNGQTIFNIMNNDVILLQFSSTNNPCNYWRAMYHDGKMQGDDYQELRQDENPWRGILASPKNENGDYIPIHDWHAASKKYVDVSILKELSGYSKLKFKKVDVLPQPTAADKNTIYLILDNTVSPELSGNNIYNQYIVMDDKWQKLGTTRINLNNYYTKEDIDNKGYLTQHQSLSGYYTKDQIEAKGYLTKHQSLSSYYTKEDIDNKGYLTEHQSLSSYYTKGQIEAKGYLTEHQSLSGYYTKEDIDNKGYLTEHQSLSGYYTKDQIEAKGYLTEHQSLTGYYTKNQIEAKGYLTEHQSLSGYYTKDDIDNKGYLTEHQSLTGYYTKGQIEAKGYLTEHQSLSGYYTKDDIDNKGYLTEHQSLSSYYTKNQIEAKGYLTEHQSLSGYYTKDDIDNKGYLTEHQSLSSYYTKNQIEAKGYLTEHQSLTGYYTKGQIEAKGYLTEHQSLTGYYTKDDIDNKGYLTEHQSLTGYYTKDQTSSAIDLTNTFNNKADKATTLSGYNISDAYTKNQTDITIASAVAEYSKLKFKKVDTLPEIVDADKNIIYLILDNSGSPQLSGNNVYNQYIIIDNKWQKLGTTRINLSNYDTKQQINTKIDTALNSAYAYTDQQIASAVTSAYIYTNQQITSAVTSANTYTNNTLSGYYTTEQIDVKLTAIWDELSGIHETLTRIVME